MEEKTTKQKLPYLSNVIRSNDNVWKYLLLGRTEGTRMRIRQCMQWMQECGAGDLLHPLRNGRRRHWKETGQFGDASLIRSLAVVHDLMDSDDVASGLTF